MVSENYACAYKEVVEVLKHTRREDVNKIPALEIILWKQNMKKDYNFEIDNTKPIEEQNLSKEAKAILANIFKKYWATDYQKERIEAKEKYDLEQIELEKNIKYNPDDLFKNRHNVTTVNDEIQQESTSMLEYKEKNFLQKIFDKIKHLFKK